MQILIVSATEMEVEPLRQELGTAVQRNKYHYKHLVIDLLISGVGMTATAFALGRHLVNKNYDLIINLGLAGAFDRELNLAQVVEVITDCFPEMGAENGQQFLSLSDLQLQAADAFPFEKAQIKADLPENLYQTHRWEKVHGITVNTVHGNPASIAELESIFQPQVESMEGAAFFYACRMMDFPCIQLRSISNYVEKRNKAAWKIDPAIQNLTKDTLFLLNDL